MSSALHATDALDQYATLMMMAKWKVAAIKSIPGDHFIGNL